MAVKVQTNNDITDIIWSLTIKLILLLYSKPNFVKHAETDEKVYTDVCSDSNECENVHRN